MNDEWGSYFIIHHLLKGKSKFLCVKYSVKMKKTCETVGFTSLFC